MQKSRLLTAACLSVSLLATTVIPVNAASNVVSVVTSQDNQAVPQAPALENRDGHQEADGLTVVSGILLVNKKHPLPANYAPAYAGNAAMSTTLHGEANAAVQNFIAGARQAGYNMYVLSGYRSYNYQASLFNNYAAAHGRERANMFSALPGQSEHQTGLAFDVGDASASGYNLQTYMENLASTQWMMAHCADYGFILRYPKGKEAITGYQYEPWHFRYVGVDTAKSIMSSGLTLEEYLGDGASLPNQSTAPRRMAIGQNSKISLDGTVSSLSSENIENYIYFRLRDLGTLLVSSKAPFDVSYDEKTQTIALQSQTPMKEAGRLLTLQGNKIALKNTMPVTVDGKSVQLSAYNIDGFTYYKLRDLGALLGFHVDWNENEQMIEILTDGNKTGSVENLMEAVSPSKPGGDTVIVTVQ